MKNAKLAVLAVLKNKVVYCSTNDKKCRENGRKVENMHIVGYSEMVKIYSIAKI